MAGGNSSVMSESISQKKSQLRAALREKLSRLTEADRRTRSGEACRRLSREEVFTHAQTVMMYMSLPQEVDLASLAMRCFQEGKTVCVPRVDWTRREMVAVSIQTYDDRLMDIDDHGVRMPAEGELVIPSSIDLIVIPGLGFDANGHRLGRGGGFYDRYLAKLSRNVTKAAMAFDEQIVDEVPMEPHDVAVDVVVTDRRVIRAGRSPLRRPR